MNKWRKDNNHNPLNCEGAICAADPDSGWQVNRIWYPDEPVCNATPLAQWQKTQRKLARLYAKGKLKDPSGYWNAVMLDQRWSISASAAGRSPNPKAGVLKSWDDEDSGYMKGKYGDQENRRPVSAAQKANYERLRLSSPLKLGAKT